MYKLKKLNVNTDYVDFNGFQLSTKGMMTTSVFDNP